MTNVTLTEELARLTWDLAYEEMSTCHEILHKEQDTTTKEDRQNLRDRILELGQLMEAIDPALPDELRR